MTEPDGTTEPADDADATQDTADEGTQADETQDEDAGAAPEAPTESSGYASPC